MRPSIPDTAASVATECSRRNDEKIRQLSLLIVHLERSTWISAQDDPIIPNTHQIPNTGMKREAANPIIMAYRSLDQGSSVIPELDGTLPVRQDRAHGKQFPWHLHKNP